MHGETVVVRSFGGVPLVRKVWELGEDVVYLVTEDNFNLLTKGDLRAIGPIGFPKEDVFIFDTKYAESISRSIPNWGNFRPAYK